jgi:hypothetical protein
MTTRIQTIRRKLTLCSGALIVVSLAAAVGLAGAVGFHSGHGRVGRHRAVTVQAPGNRLALARRFSEPAVGSRNLPARVNPFDLARRFSEP